MLTSRPRYSTLALTLVALFASSGCIRTKFKLTRSGDALPPREANCEFEMFTVPPAGSYREIGTIDIIKTGGDLDALSLTSVRTHIGPTVCDAGADAAIAFSNGTGYYKKVTLLVKTEAAADASAREASASAPEAGCSYDTQCKGDRICEAGTCVAPPPTDESAEP